MRRGVARIGSVRCRECSLRRAQAVAGILPDASRAGMRRRRAVRLPKWATMAACAPDDTARPTRRIFEPYTTTRKIGEGMGLGLAICRKILLDHGGDLEWVEAPGPGATFRLSLPIQPISELRPATATKE